MSDSPPSKSVATFETALERLQEIVHELEDGDLGLETSLAHFEEGVGLLRNCYRTLEQAERRIEILIGADANGDPLTAPFDAAATIEPAEPSTRKPGRRRTGANPAAVATETPPETSKPDDQRLF
jgi:exodeoxyribonuclease VII small subunit